MMTSPREAYDVKMKHMLTVRVFADDFDTRDPHALVFKINGIPSVRFYKCDVEYVDDVNAEWLIWDSSCTTEEELRRKNTEVRSDY